MLIVMAATILLGLQSQSAATNVACPKGSVLICHGSEATQVCKCERFP